MVRAFDGGVPGPKIRARQGARVRIGNTVTVNALMPERFGVRAGERVRL